MDFLLAHTKSTGAVRPIKINPLHSTPLHSTPLHSTPLHSTPLHFIQAVFPKGIWISVKACPYISPLVRLGGEKGKTDPYGVSVEPAWIAGFVQIKADGSFGFMHYVQ
jgi:hypothetical protein